MFIMCKLLLYLHVFEALPVKKIPKKKNKKCNSKKKLLI